MGSSHSFGVGLWQLLSIFPQLRMFWIPLHFWRTFSLGEGFWVDSSFVSTHGKYCVSSFWHPWFLMRNPVSLNCFSPVGEVSFLFCCFHNRIVFRRGAVMHLGTDFLRSALLGVCAASWIYRFVPVAKWSKISVIISWTLPSTADLPSLSRTAVTWTFDLCCSPAGQEALFILFPLFPPCHSDWMTSVVLSSRSLSPSSGPSVRPPSGF